MKWFSYVILMIIGANVAVRSAQHLQSFKDWPWFILSMAGFAILDFSYHLKYKWEKRL